MKETNHSNTHHHPFISEPLSPEYFAALSSCPSEDIHQLLCSSPEVNQQLKKHAQHSSFQGTHQEQEDGDESTIAPAQAFRYLSVIVSRSPSFQFPQQQHPIDSDSNAGAASSSSFSWNHVQAGGNVPPLPPPPPNQLLSNIRHAAQILAKAQKRHLITSCGILSKLRTAIFYFAQNPNVYLEFLECCILACQYQYARKYMHRYEEWWCLMQTRDDPSQTGIHRRNVYPHIVGGAASGGDDEDGFGSTLVFLRYHYLRGIVFYACEDVSGAIMEWNHCLTVPCSGILNSSSSSGGSMGGGGGISMGSGNSGRGKMSQVTLCAWKKWVLAKCLLCQYDDDMIYNHEKDGSDGVMLKEDVTIGMGNRMGDDDQGEDTTSSKAIKRRILSLPVGTSTMVRRILQTKREVGGVSKTLAPLSTCVSSSALGMESTQDPLSLSSSSSFSSLEKEVEYYTKIVEKFARGDDLAQWFMKCKCNSVKERRQVGENEMKEQVNADVDSTSDDDGCMMLCFEQDGNMGMIKRLLPVIRWMNLRRISNIYSAISVQQLSTKLGMKEVECMEFLLQVAMKQDIGRNYYRTPIKFLLDGERGVVYFEEDDDMEEEEDAVSLQEKLVKCMTLVNRVRDLDISIATSTRYQMNLLKNADDGKKGKMRSGAGHSVLDLS